MNEMLKVSKRLNQFELDQGICFTKIFQMFFSSYMYRLHKFARVCMCLNVGSTGNFDCCKQYFYKMLSDIDVGLTCWPKKNRSWLICSNFAWKEKNALKSVYCILDITSGNYFYSFYYWNGFFNQRNWA